MKELMSDSPSIVLKTPTDAAIVEPQLPLAQAATPARWVAALTAKDQSRVRWVPTADLQLHPACAFLPFLERSFLAIRESVHTHGVLYPLAIDAKTGQVLDGRYRLKAAMELKFGKLPVLAIDVEGDAAVQWVFTMKEDREHLGEAERAVMAVQFQKRLSSQYVQRRAKKMTTGRLGQAPAKGDKPQPKLDSRKETCAKFKVPVRMFNAVKKLSADRPDLFEKVLAGEMDPAAAIKKKGRNVELARVEHAITQALPLLPATHPEQIENNIHCGDAVEVMKRVPDGVASLILFSPPYHGVPILYDPPLPEQTYTEYLDYQRQLLVECFRASRSGGRLAIVLDTVRNHEADLKHYMLPVVTDISNLAFDCGWSYLNDLAWYKDEISGSKTNFGSFGLCSAPCFGRNHETILLVCKDTHKLEGDPALCDLTGDEHLAWRPTGWHIKPEVDKTRLLQHPAPYPEEIPHRLIKMLTYRKDLIIDPYNGSGTTTTVAHRLGRRYLGIDRSETYVRQALARISADGLPQQPALGPAEEAA
jgi:site-specific DNA-methyltransferase (adenine-specific)